jgi:tripartite-type tricarboxylate transporter receptor subunit TctC
MIKNHKVISFILAVTILAGLLSACGSSTNQGDKSEQQEIDWPKKAIEIVVPASAGGDTDFNARTIAKYLTEELGQPVVCVNITGGGGSVATDEFKNSKPDGYRFLIMHSPMHTNEAFGVTDYGYDAFDPVCVVGMGGGEFVAVRSDFPANDMQGLIEETKKNPGKYKYAASIGATSHYMAVKLKLMGADLTVVPTGSAADRVVGLKGGHVDIINVAMPTIQDYVATGEFKVLAICSSERNPSYPEIPTCIEQGVNAAFDPTYTMYAVKGTDPAIIKKMSEAVANIVNNNKSYAEEIMTAYKQQPYYLDTAKTLVLLAEQRERFMSIADELRKGF